MLKSSLLLVSISVYSQIEWLFFDDQKDLKQSAIMYQLQQLGAHLARPQGKVVDERVSFLPDDWQETLLNVVDAQESALVRICFIFVIH